MSIRYWTSWLLVLLLLGWGLPSTSLAQSGRIEGRIADAERGVGLPGVNAGIEGTSLGAVTNPTSAFAIEGVSPGEYEAVASFVGYETRRKSVTVTAGETAPINFTFEPADVALQKVEVIGREATSYSGDSSFAATRTATPVENVPQSISVVTKELIDDQQVYRLDEVFKNVSEMNTFSGYNDYTTRGFRSSDARLLNDLKAGFPLWDNPLLPHIERVEVIKGPASALFASTNPGGTVNMVTKKPLPSSRRLLSSQASRRT